MLSYMNIIHLQVYKNISATFLVFQWPTYLAGIGFIGNAILPYW